MNKKGQSASIITAAVVLFFILIAVVSASGLGDSISDIPVQDGCRPLNHAVRVSSSLFIDGTFTAGLKIENLAVTGTEDLGVTQKTVSIREQLGLFSTSGNIAVWVEDTDGRRVSDVSSVDLTVSTIGTEQWLFDNDVIVGDNNCNNRADSFSANLVAEAKNEDGKLTDRKEATFRFGGS